MDKKGQSAMEYLMTYGWAILVVLIALGALFALGVFDSGGSNTCDSTSGPIACTDVKMDTAGVVTLVLGSSGTSSAELTSVDISAPVDETACTPTSSEISTVTPTGLDCDVGSSTYDEGDEFQGVAEITYELQGSDIEHTTTISFSGSVEAA